MIEVMANGRIYVFPEESEILDYLDMKAESVRNEDGCTAEPTGAKPGYVKGGRAYTHDIAALLLEPFEDMLCAKDMKVPCSDADEEADRDAGTALYGTEYSELLDAAEETVCEVLDAFGVPYVQGEFTGDC